MEPDDYSRRIERELTLAWEREAWRIEEIHYAIINSAKAEIATHSPRNAQWITSRLQAAKQRAIRAEQLLAKLASAEANYRYVHDCEGDSAALVVGRAWDAMRKAGDEARSFIGEPDED